jgi:hypothetical protein
MKRWHLTDAPSALILYSVGSALPVFTMSLVKSKAIAGQDGDADAQDYSIVMLARSMGSLVGLPIMTVAWAKGIGIGGPALGLPYFLSAVRGSRCEVIREKLIA